jgi:hypothetical protein
VAGFRTLRERMSGAPDPNEVLPQTVLPHMRQPLLNWLNSCTGDYTPLTWERLCQMLKIDYTGKYPQDAFITAINQDNELLLDAIDARLKFSAWQQIDALELTLKLAGSGWQVNGGNNGLEQVVSEAVRQAALDAIAAAKGSAAGHLKEAWIATYGKSRNPTLAHSEMIRAVESASIPVVTPKDTRATLGTIIGQLSSQAALYTTAGASAKNDGIAGIVAMMQMLWEQQTDRHGASPTIPATRERVEMLMPIAAALVHAFSTGAVRRQKP